MTFDMDLFNSKDGALRFSLVWFGYTRLKKLSNRLEHSFV